MDTASTASFDHFDFDTSFCSLKSTDMMEHGDLADQLTLVQQMVVEMKTGFSRAMEELAKIQYGDQTLQQQLADNTKQASTQIETVTETVQQLKGEMQQMSECLKEVCDTQKGLQEKLDTYQADKDMLLAELTRSGAISHQTRVVLCGGNVPENNNTIPPDVAPMVHPYLNSLQNLHRVSGRDDYNSDSSLTAAVSRSLNLTQALGEKCLNMDVSTSSSDDEDTCRPRRESSNRPNKRQATFQFEGGHSQASQKIAPHEQVLDKVQREEAVRDMIEEERDYCSQLWALLEDYMKPLSEHTIISQRDYNLLFPSYIPHMYEHHCILLRKMEERLKKWKSSGVIGDVFAKFTESSDGDGLMLYKEFINDFPSIISTMNKCFSQSPHFRDLMQSQYLASSPVLQLLLAPLQQVPKYSILLKGLLKHTATEHPDRYYLECSLTKLKQFLNSMNDDLEQAMHTINVNSQPVNRAREVGNSARSKSSASSGEVNHVSRDSGVHSNEEERAKSPMSPTTNRRYVLQALKDKREREQRLHASPDGRPPTPTRSGKQASYGSHPDLSRATNRSADGRTSPYLASLSHSKTSSSLSKLPLPRQPSNPRRSRAKKQHEGQRPAINSKYLRPLTPQVFPTSISAHNFDVSKRHEEYSERMRQRPASAMEFGYPVPDQHDEYLEMLAQQANLKISPAHSSSSERSRQELQQSLQKLLAETGNCQEEFSEGEYVEGDDHVSYHKQFLATKGRMMRHQDKDHAALEMDNMQEDYGIYGDDDEDDDVDDTQQQPKPMQLLQDSHRPKIMVPKWRQSSAGGNQPPTYNESVNFTQKLHPGGTAAEANLAASLAQSLFDGKPKQSTLPREKKPKKVIRTSFDGNVDTTVSKASLKRKTPGMRMDSPVRSPVRQNTLPEPAETTRQMARGFSLDGSPNRPMQLSISNQQKAPGMALNFQQAEPVSPGTSTSSDNQYAEQSAVTKNSSVAKLTDVIAYTADCLEKSESQTEQAIDNNSENDMSFKSHVVDRPTGKMRISDILANNNMKVSSVDSNSSVVHHPMGGESSETDHCDTGGNTSTQSPISTSGTSNSNTPTSASTDNVVYYFQNRDKINQGNTDGGTLSPESSSKIPVFSSMNKTSTPVHEHKQFHAMGSDQGGLNKQFYAMGSDQGGLNKQFYAMGSDQGGVKDGLPRLGKKQSARLVRDDEASNETDSKQAAEYGQVKSKASYGNVDSASDSTSASEKEGGATKERVLKAVDQLRMTFERQKQLSEERKLVQGQGARSAATSPTSLLPIQKHFNDMSRVGASAYGHKPAPLRSLSSPSYASSSTDEPDSPNTSEPVEQKHGLYSKNVCRNKQPSQYQADALASARQIQKRERATSPTERSLSPNRGNTGTYDKFKGQVEASHLSRPTMKVASVNNPRSSVEGSLIPQRSRSPTRASVEKERPKSTSDISFKIDKQKDEQALKSAMKDTKIPVFKKSSSIEQPMSKSTEDISKIKKKSSPFKDQIKNLFGRKKSHGARGHPQLSTRPYTPEEVEIV